MKTIAAWVLAGCLLGGMAETARAAVPLAGPTAEESIVQAATAVLDEIMAIPGRAIPQALLRDAEGVAIVPNVVKLGFVVGIRHGRGVVLMRDQAGGWGAPIFVRLSGGSVGWQAGLQATDVVLVFKSRRSLEGLTRGKFTLGADASVAAGPVGRNASAATDVELKAEIYSYSRSRGLFVGVALDGSMLQIDHLANHRYYAQTGQMPYGPQGDPVAPLPASARRLMERLALYSAGPGARWDRPEGGPQLAGAQPAADDLRRSLATSATALNRILDQRWRQFLALPEEVFTGARPPSVQRLAEAVQRYDRVASDPKYRALAERSEFARTRQLLRQYLSQRTATAAVPLPLPAPPASLDGAGRSRY